MTDKERLADPMRETQRLGQEKALQALHDENERLGLYKDAYAEQEPVATVTSEAGADITMSWWHEPALPIGTKLYTHPPQRTEQCNYPDCKCPTEDPCLKGLAQPEQEPLIGCVNHDCAKCKPLTEEQIVAKALHLSGLGTSPDVLQFARAIEAAHGIKENT
jgi:hypothetical protein